MSRDEIRIVGQQSGGQQEGGIVMEYKDIREIEFAVENLMSVKIEGRYIEYIHIGNITDTEYGKQAGDFRIKLKAEGSIGFAAPEADPDDPSTWEYMNEYTENKYEMLHKYTMVNKLKITYRSAEGESERTDCYSVYWPDWSDNELENMLINSRQFSHIDEQGNLYMVISKETGLEEAFPEITLNESKTDNGNIGFVAGGSNDEVHM